uniref:Uncharacterized protein n=1 Tax=Nelumbo nucifera TaxID=4432 RepID=A0A822ZCN6_NELNU|nr:TPA_asm: hypothetical protein HUJ06_013631 [Nelumbo nucifera]
MTQQDLTIIVLGMTSEMHGENKQPGIWMSQVIEVTTTIYGLLATSIHL